MSQRWFLARDGRTFGPFSSADLKAQAEAGQLGPEQLVLLQGQTRWVKAASLRGLFPAGGPDAPRAEPVAPAGALVNAGSPAEAGAEAEAKAPDVPGTPNRRRHFWAGATLAVVLVPLGGLVTFLRGKPDPAPVGVPAAQAGKPAPAGLPVAREGNAAPAAGVPAARVGKAAPAAAGSGADLDEMAALLGQGYVVGRQEFRRPADPQLIQEIRGRAGSGVREVALAAAAAEEPIKWRSASLEMAAGVSAKNQERIKDSLKHLPAALASLDSVSDSQLDEAVASHTLSRHDADEIRDARNARDSDALGGLAMPLLKAAFDRRSVNDPVRWNRKRADVLEAEVFAKHLAPALRARAGARADAPPIELRVGVKPDDRYREAIGLVSGASKADRPLTRVALLLTVELPIGTRYVAAYLPRLGPSDAFRLSPFGADYHELYASPRPAKGAARRVRYSLWCDQLSAEDVEVPVGDDRGALLAYAAQLALPGSSYLADPNSNMGGNYKAAKARALAKQASRKRMAEMFAGTSQASHPVLKGKVELPDPSRDQYRRFGLTFTEFTPRGEGYFVRARFDRYDAEDPAKLTSSAPYEGTLRSPEPEPKPEPNARVPAKPGRARLGAPVKARAAPEPPPVRDDLVCELGGGDDLLRLRVRIAADGDLNWTPDSRLLLGRRFQPEDLLKAREARTADFRQKNDVLSGARRLAMDGKQDEAARVVNDFLATSPGAPWEAEARTVLGDLDRLATKYANRRPRGPRTDAP